MTAQTTNSGIANGQGTMNVSTAKSSTTHQVEATTPTSLNLLSDKDLFKLSRQYGLNAKKYSRLFASLLPEILKRRLHRKHDCASIYEYAAKFCGMTKETVNEILRIYAQLEDKPLIKAQLVSQGWSKVRVVMSVLTKENEKIVAEKLAGLSKGALTEWIKEVRSRLLGQQSLSNDHKSATIQGATSAEIQTRIEKARLPDMSSSGPSLGSTKPILMFGELAGEEPASQKTWFDGVKNREEMETTQFQNLKRIEMKVDDKTELQFKILKTQLEKQHGALTNGETLKLLLNKIKALETHNQEATQNLSASQNPELHKLTKIQSNNQETSRYIPKILKIQLEQKYQGKCAYPTCNRPSIITHHPERFSLTHNHKNLAPICKIHHELAHNSLIENETEDSKNWQLKTTANPHLEADILYRRHRQTALIQNLSL